MTVANNTLDEAIALTVAGNQVLQDPLTVGQSLKTISLRLQGTSIEDMQEAGEEIDGLISTQSKLKQTIMDATRVASNNYKGFDILDQKGNYKSTYEILKGISQIYQEIGEEDKKFGTNRQSLILETIAGKTRAAAASSILSNPQVLEEVFESASDSAGSAQAELDKYLESVEGHVMRLQNHLQELAAVNINSDWLKAMISLADSAVKVITKITDAVGGVNIAIGAVVGTLTSLTGHGKLKWVRQKP